MSDDSKKDVYAIQAIADRLTESLHGRKSIDADTMARRDHAAIAKAVRSLSAYPSELVLSVLEGR